MSRRRRSRSSPQSAILLQCLFCITAFCPWQAHLYTGVHAVTFVRHCPIESSPPVEIDYDADQGVFVHVPKRGDRSLLRQQQQQQPNRIRKRNLLLQSSSTDTVLEVNPESLSLAIHLNDTRWLSTAESRRNDRHHNRRNNNNNNSSSISTSLFPLKVRQCPCAYFSVSKRHVPAFCPLEKTSCGVTRHSEVVCLTQSSRTVLIRNAWPVVVLWFAALVLFLVFTEQGRHARHYLMTKTFRRNLNHGLVQQILSSTTTTTTTTTRNGRTVAQWSNGVPPLPPSTRFWALRGRQQQPPPPEEPTRLPPVRLLRRQQEWILQQRAAMMDPSILIAQSPTNDTDENGFVQTDQELFGPSNPAGQRPTRLALKTTRYVATTTTTRQSSRQDGDTTTTTIDTVAATATDNESGAHHDDTDDGVENTVVDNTLVDDDDDDDENTCTICFTPLQDGDRVGALPCQHMFHVDCLKVWLTRRNACPLCAVPAALPQYEPTTTTVTTRRRRRRRRRRQRDASGNENGRDQVGNNSNNHNRRTTRHNHRLEDRLAQSINNSSYYTGDQEGDSDDSNDVNDDDSQNAELGFDQRSRNRVRDTEQSRNYYLRNLGRF